MVGAVNAVRLRHGLYDVHPNWPPVLYDSSYNSTHSGRTHRIFVRCIVQNNARRPIAPYFCTIFSFNPPSTVPEHNCSCESSYTPAWIKAAIPAASPCHRRQDLARPPGSIHMSTPLRCPCGSSDHRRYTACRLRMIVRNSSSSSTGISLSRFHLYRQRSGGQSISRFVRIVARSRDR